MICLKEELNNQNNKNKGFTLIELLVVISIIGLLSTVVLASLKDARDKAKMRKFENELIQLKTAIQLYRENYNGEWPEALKTAPIDDATSSKSLIIELNNKKLLGSSVISMPSNNIYVEGLYIYPGIKTNPDRNIVDMSCGNSKSDSAYFILAIGSNAPLKTNLPLQYWFGEPVDGVSYLGSYGYCLEIR